MTRPSKINDGRLGLPVWKPERVFNLSAIEVTIEDPEIKDNPKQGRTYKAPVAIQFWMSAKEGDDYEAIAEVVLPAGEHRAFAFASYVNGLGFEEVVRIPETAQVVVVTNAYNIEVTALPGESTTDFPETKPQLDIKPHGTFL